MSEAIVERPRSVREETDAELLAWAIDFYRRRPSRGFDTIVDVTWGRGRFWQRVAYPVVGLDLAPHDGAQVGADFRALPLRSGAIDVLVFDPPHVSEQGPRGQVAHRQGFADAGVHEVSDLFAPFLVEAVRVLSPGGVLLAKVADQVHRCASRWQHVDFIIEAQRAGLTVCDLLIKVRRNCIMDPRWKAVLHARKSHCFWIVCRKGKC